MKIVVDDKIPFIKDTINEIADEARYISGQDISSEDVKDADALIVRTRTMCNRHLLEGSNVRFVATATIGFDHIDTEYMNEAGIKWMNCPGCNAASVAQYVKSTLILLNRDRGLNLKESCLGIIGCGHVGTKVKKVAEELGMKILVNDPPREKQGDKEQFVTIDDIAKKCDIITFHVPMIKEGHHATWHLCDSYLLEEMDKTPFIINTSRGSVVDNIALMKALCEKRIKDAIIDTWENEPDIYLPLLNKVYIGTPHIAGYSADGKANADNMVIEGLCRHFGLVNKYHIDPPTLPDTFQLPNNKNEAALTLYNPLEDSKMLKSHPERFEWLRGNYPLRRETI
jgi:erythronate-4-phosphate dehydrogenase